jgi:succinoglycan biosynthesis protein ExoV
VILYQWRGSRSNFGDALNGLLWPRLLPNFFDTDPATRFLGIGSVLDRRHDDDAIKIVAGAGYGGYEPPIRLDMRWIIHWVRGPRTARQLGLNPSMGLGDPAALIPLVWRRPAAPARDVGFMPHFESLARGYWDRVTRAAGVTLIDPRDPPETVLFAIARCRLLISEALHGVIVADALRIPWRAARPLDARHRAKWWDWADSLGVDPRFDRLSPSSCMEWVHATGWHRYSPLRQALARCANVPRGPVIGSLISRAAERLGAVGRQDGNLSSDHALARVRDQMLDRIEALRRAPLRGAAWISNSPALPSRLPAAGEFAYHPAVTG